MKYTKKLYYGNFAPARVMRPKNEGLRLITDTLFSPWYLILFVVLCSFYPSAIFADSCRYLKLQYIRLNNENSRKVFITNFQNRKLQFTNRDFGLWPKSWV